MGKDDAFDRRRTALQFLVANPGADVAAATAAGIDPAWLIAATRNGFASGPMPSDPGRCDGTWTITASGQLEHIPFTSTRILNFRNSWCILAH